jgi:hypothetical protein
MPRVQEYIVRSGRYHLSARRYATIRDALIHLKAMVRTAIRDVSPDCEVTTDRETYFAIIKNGKELRRYTLVNKRGEQDGIPFGHLLKLGRATNSVWNETQ